MSETITASLTVSGGDVITAEINTLARGPAGPTGASGASTWDDITGSASDVPFLPVAAPAHSEGLVFYDSTDKSLTYYNDEADVSMNIGREMWVRVRNNSGAQISNGKVVYINDALGQLPTIRLARADSATTSRVIGIATHDIGNNEFGYVTTTGEVKGLATNAYQDGDLLFLSAVTAGEMTTTAPLAPNRVIQVATVLHAHPTQGKLYCHPETDSIPSTGIVDSTTTGRALLTASTQSDARTTGLGSGATGDELFRATSASVARTTLGSRTFTKPSDESRSSNSTYTVDTHLKDIPLEIGKSYKIEFYIPAYVPSTEGGKVRLLLPLSSRVTVPNMNGGVSVTTWGNGSGGSVSTTASGAPTGMRYFILQASAGHNQNRAITGVAFTDVIASSANLSVEWAQNTSGINATILLAGSTIVVTEL